jgi:HK97 family phage prohead protease
MVPKSRGIVQSKVKEYKVILTDIKATNDQKGIIEGYLNVVSNIDDGGDRSMPNAFKRTLDLSYARKTANGYDFLWPYLWNHDYNIIPPGGIFDADEVKAGGGKRPGLFTKTQLNLDMQMGRDLYSSMKLGTLRKQSMGYIPHQYEWVKEGGQMVRNLLEIEIVEGSAVVFPMNDLAAIEVVKSRQQPRNFYIPNRMPDGRKGGDTMADMTSMAGQLEPLSGQKFDILFMQLMIQHHQAAIAMSELAPDRAKQADLKTLASDIISAQTKEIDEMTTWLADWYNEKPSDSMSGMSGDSKSHAGATRRNFSMPNRIPGKQQQAAPARKDFNDNFRVQQIADWRNKWYSLSFSLQKTVQDAFTMGDEPLQDCQDALNGNDNSPGFIQQFLAWVQEGVDLDYSNYLQELQQSDPDAYDMMSNPRQHSRKVGARNSQADLQTLGQHIAGLYDVSDQISAMADDLAQNTGATTYVDPDGNPDDATQDGKSTSSRTTRGAPGRHVQHPPAHKGTAADDLDLGSALAQLGNLRNTVR